MAVMTYAAAAAAALQSAMQADPSIVALGEDLGRGGIFGQYRGLLETFGPERVIDTPISEATIVGAAVGMALTGLKPVVEMRVIDFALCAMDEIVNQAAKNRFMFGGQGRVPAVIRMPIGIWSASAAQHSQSLESWFVHVPGLVVLAPSTPQDNYSLLQAALRCGDPVAHFEHKELWASEGEVDPAQRVEIGQARKLREGRDLTIVSWSKAALWSAEAAAQLAGDGIEAEVIDLRTLWPWDREAVFASARKTGRVLIVHEAVQVAGFGAEIAASLAEEGAAKVARLGGARAPVGYAPVLEAEVRLTPERIVAKARALLGR
ncbi:MAG TPA: transketolase C-terminal domain-containing protein [Ferrovibrio sp.]|uniref:alpha-ketoacid dehydrogenase subunit beta n=1 Tax=Ferrovibrio sp. TaxID=1917215 RepID=UPI002B4AD3B5|nr:transketolase C-terminal domain-containing protein [Ferrovibrio sp.]HLT78025.1 transketolase C-terminal domain-containing protein [Ferrovibrio sp.]